MIGAQKGGYLLKWINMWKGWRKRYFVIEASFLLYRKTVDHKIKGTISLQDADIRMSEKDELEIIIKYSHKRLRLKTGSVTEKMQWINWLRQAQTLKPEGPKAELDKSQELTLMLEKRFGVEGDKVTSSLAKIYSIHTYLEDTLSTFVGTMEPFFNKDETKKALAEQLEDLSNELKAEIITGLKLSRKQESMAKEEKDSESDIDDERFDTANEEEIIKNENSPEEEVEHRLGLPVKRSNLAKVSIWQVIKDMIGKDLTRFSIPIHFMEPISMLQKVAESLEYEECLRKAANSSDSLIRMAYVAAFLVASYCSTFSRTKKPFNPILGETFEYVTPTYKFFSEQVSHHPPISACYCSSDIYEFWMHTHIKFSFWGKSFEGTPLGSLTILLNKWNEHYTLTRPTTAGCNLIIGKMYVDNYGDCVITNHKTHEKAKVRFHKRGWFGNSYGNVTGTLFSSDGTPAYELEGKWTDSLSLKKVGKNVKESMLLWKRNERPAEWENYYYFPEFTYQLNNLTSRLKTLLPPTDSRLRSDQRALENGDLKLAQAEKIRLEEMQRARRKEMEKNGTEHQAAYFVEKVDPVTGEKVYVFTGKYWADRERQNWSHLTKLFVQLLSNAHCLLIILGFDSVSS
eukprot:TRINITY_DN1933_c0_g2_i3.p1 TRINITY_DN1933_c0_g2~~TRINITY_DN1933_c0_g2_i3.p1  ORF type:complete len:668 (+),score=42.50 TRINITY_DN1933_c0_g2_i3:122-2005(+)